MTGKETFAPRKRPALEPVAEPAPETAREDGSSPPSPQDAPPIDLTEPQKTRDKLAPQKADRWLRLALWTAGALIIAGASVSIYDLVATLFARSDWLGWAAFALAALFAVAVLTLAMRELAALGRMRRIDKIREDAARARAENDAAAGRRALAGLERLYADRADIAWARDGAAQRLKDVVDIDQKLDLAERAMLAALDERARGVVGQSARHVAAATALMPSALIDAVAALYVNIRMIRRVAEIYGGRAGFAGSIRLARKVVEHAMAAGLIAFGDDLLEPLIGGGVAGRLSRRAGEGVVNGALTARIGVAAIEVCRPLPFSALPKPKLRELVWTAVRGAKKEVGRRQSDR